MKNIEQFSTLEELKKFYDNLDGMMTIFKRVNSETRPILAPTKVLRELKAQELIDWVFNNVPATSHGSSCYQIPKVLMSQTMHMDYIQKLVNIAYKHRFVVNEGKNIEYYLTFFQEPEDEKNEVKLKLMNFVGECLKFIRNNPS